MTTCKQKGANMVEGITEEDEIDCPGHQVFRINVCIGVGRVGVVRNRRVLVSIASVVRVI